MNILFICNEYPPGRSGGIGTATRNLAVALKNKGHQVFIAGLYPPGYGQHDFEMRDGISIWRRRYRLDNRWLRPERLTSVGISWLLRKSGLMRLDAIYTAKKFLDFIKWLVVKYDIAIIEWPDFNEWLQYTGSGNQSNGLPVPVIVKLHGTHSYIEHRLGGKVNRISYRNEQEHLQQASALLAVSKHTANGNRQFYDLPAEIPVLYNAVPVEPVSVTGTPKNTSFVYFGTLAASKGLAVLMHAWNSVHEKYPHATLEVYGKGKIKPFKNLLTKKAQRTVHFRGFATQETIRETLPLAAGAVFPSFSECFSLAPMEAMACGCPVIYTSRASGTELISDGINGLLVDPADVYALAVAIGSLLDAPQYARQLGLQGRETIATRFCPSLAAEMHLRFYQEVISNYSVAHA